MATRPHFRAPLLSAIGACFALSLAVAAPLAHAGQGNISDSRARTAPVKPGAVTAAPYVVTGKQIISASGQCSRVIVNIKGVVTGTTDDGGGLDTVTYELWDDGEVKDSEVVSIPVGLSMAVDVTLEFEGLYKTGAPGVGVLESETGLLIDPFYPTDEAGTCSANPIKCWISPNVVQRGEQVTFFAEVPNGAAKMRAYNGDLPVARLTDPDGDRIYTGTYTIPSNARYGWNYHFGIHGVTLQGEKLYCMGARVDRATPPR